jgi:hypothetical protein
MLNTPRPRALVCSFSRTLAPVAVELHHFINTGQFFLWPPGLNASHIQWGDSELLVTVKGGGLLDQPPPIDAVSVRVFAGDKQFLVPVLGIKKMHSLLQVGTAKDTVRVEIRYGLALRTTPEPGDTEQLVTISAESKQPIRLARLESVVSGATTMYTAVFNKGFAAIIDPTRALDLVVACNGMMGTDSLTGWLGSALGLMGHRVEAFVKLSCARSQKVSKLYWLVPYRSVGTRRGERVDVQVLVDFI